MKPMLAGTMKDPKALAFPMLGSPKLDGVRCLIIDGVAMSRNFKPIPNDYVQMLFGRAALNGFDGELIIGKPTDPDCYRNTVSGVMRKDGKPDVTFYAFDDFGYMEAGFTRRFESVRDRIADIASMIPQITLVGHIVLNSEVDMDLMEHTSLEQGYEGIMLRSISGPYKYGRSTEREGYLLKVKRFSDGEAVIIGFDEKMHNANEATVDELGRTKRSSHKANKEATGTLGALKVRGVGGDYDGVEFDIGTGFDDHLRQLLWDTQDGQMGVIVKFKYFPTGSKDKPRFPTFLGFRPEGA